MQSQKIRPQHERIILGALLRPCAPPIATSIRLARQVMQLRGINDDFSDSTCRRWIQRWRERNFHIWVFIREGLKRTDNRG